MYLLIVIATVGALGSSPMANGHVVTITDTTSIGNCQAAAKLLNDWQGGRVGVYAYCQPK